MSNEETIDTRDLLNRTNGNFENDKEYENVRSNTIPQVMLDLPETNSDRKQLTKEQMKEAKSLIKKDFISSFPRDRRLKSDPPIHGQKYGLVSFIPSLGAKADKDGCFGVIRYRGSFNSVEEAQDQGLLILKKYDSFAEMDIVPIGDDLPLMIDNTSYTDKTYEVDVRATIDRVTKEQKQKKMEDEKKAKLEILEKERKLKDATNSIEKEQHEEDTLDYYTMLQVKKAQAQHSLEAAKKRIEEMTAVLNKTDEELTTLNDKHPTYKEQYLRQYVQGLVDSQANIPQNPLLSFMKKNHASDNNCDIPTRIEVMVPKEE